MTSISRILLAKKWLMALARRSAQHLPQGEGTMFRVGMVGGYYNDLTGKFLAVRARQVVDDEGIPVNWLHDGRRIYLATSVAQYGLGAYDVYLQSGRVDAKRAVQCCADWLVGNQDCYGGWDVWTRLGVKCLCPYSAMSQAEGASLLYRASEPGRSGPYCLAADRAVACMLRRTEEGGTARYVSGGLVLEEKVDSSPSMILNGWVFGLFGLYDAVVSTRSDEWLGTLSLACKTLARELPGYDMGYWSAYDRLGHVASPFYHRLHIAQLRVLGRIMREPAFNAYASKWAEYDARPIYRARALALKVHQKLQDPGEVLVLR